MALLNRIAAHLGDALFPPSCAGCGAETMAAHALCPACWADTTFIAGPVCPCCGRPVDRDPTGAQAGVCDLCAAAPPGWDRARGAVLYRGTARRMILGLKHGDRLDAVPAMARWLARAGAPLLDRADAVVPVPLHWTRRLKRRCNQSAELARAVLAETGQAGLHAPGLLIRARRTPSQGGRDREARVANVSAAFTVPARARARVEGARIVLVDDVLTTGATLSAAARAFRQVGAMQVDALVIALVHRPDSTYLAAETPAEDWRA